MKKLDGITTFFITADRKPDDGQHSLDEDRWITIGKEQTNLILVVVHTFHEENIDNCKIRLISARKATKKEIKQYEGDEP